MMADIFRVPDGDFHTKGGRFGPHQFNETQNNTLNRPQDNRNLLYVAYFAGGLRVLDISEPNAMKEVGYYLPKTTATTIPRLKTVIQTHDVDLDYRGLAYISDRAGTGMHVVEYLGCAATASQCRKQADRSGAREEHRPCAATQPRRMVPAARRKHRSAVTTAAQQMFCARRVVLCAGANAPRYKVLHIVRRKRPCLTHLRLQPALPSLRCFVPLPCMRLTPIRPSRDG
jgi:hypothetical protein